jgi:hypothetical protein
MRLIPTPDELRNIVEYSPETGKIFWRERPVSYFCDARSAKSWNSKHAGKEAFTTLDGAGYLYGRVNRIALAAHRVAFAMVNGRWPNTHVDHLNRNKSDHRISNLREASPEINGKNCKRRSDNKTGVTGVVRDGEIYRAEICSAGKRFSLGKFQSIEHAAIARRAAEKVLGFHENHGR